ncbi:MAG: AraC family transcriptional regulator [Methyloceanibacter sp.]|nr:AraC family transcriptional regulator [Methyloceanibacter sp.]
MGTDDKRDTRTGSSTQPKRFAFSTDAFPARLDSRARQRLWMDQSEELFGTYNISFSEDHPFEAHLDFTDFGRVQLLRSRMTMTGVARTVQNIADDGSHDFFLHINLGSAPALARQRGQELEITPGTMGLTSLGEPGVSQLVPLETHWTVCLPRSMLSDVLQDPDDLTMRRLDPQAHTSRFLHDYLAFLFHRSDVEMDAALTGHVDRTLTDLIALALGANRDQAELAQLRGTRAAQLHLVLAGIEAGFSNPAFSVHVLANDLGLSQRYVQSVLSETGRSFSDRVLELRLQKARKMLSDPRFGRMKVTDIAFASGFSDAPYFNRCFRRRFGATPTQFRP